MNKHHYFFRFILNHWHIEFVFQLNTRAIEIVLRFFSSITCVLHKWIYFNFKLQDILTFVLLKIKAKK